MTTNTQIMQALFAKIEQASLAYPIAWPGIDFTPPDSGIWLEVYFQPNTPLQPGIANEASELPRGILRLVVMTRPGTGVFHINQEAENLRSIFPKGEVIADNVRVSRASYSSAMDYMVDRLGVSLVVEYSA